MTQREARDEREVINFDLPEIAYKLTTAIKDKQARLHDSNIPYECVAFAAYVSPASGLPAGRCTIIGISGNVQFDNMLTKDSYRLHLTVVLK